jgi:hypothetical protein
LYQLLQDVEEPKKEDEQNEEELQEEAGQRPQVSVQR